MMDSDHMQRDQQPEASPFLAPMRALQVSGGGETGTKIQHLLFAVFGDLTDRHALDQTDLDMVAGMFAVIAADAGQGTRSASGWRAVCELMSFVAMEDAEFPVIGSRAWGYLAALRQLYAGLDEAY